MLKHFIIEMVEKNLDSLKTTYVKRNIANVCLYFSCQLCHYLLNVHVSYVEYNTSQIQFYLKILFDNFGTGAT